MEFLNFESKVIFSRQFPDAQSVSTLDVAQVLCNGNPVDEVAPLHTFEEMLEEMKDKYTYEPRPDAAENSKKFIDLAIEVCKDFEIDTEISKRSYEIAVTMDIACSWYGGPIKRALEALLRFSDDFTVACHKSRPDNIQLTMSYRTHDMYAYGKKVDRL